MKRHETPMNGFGAALGSRLAPVSDEDNPSTQAFGRCLRRLSALPLCRSQKHPSQCASPTLGGSTLKTRNPQRHNLREFGMVKLAKELQPLKAQVPMRVTESGMVKFAKELQC